MRAAAFLDRFRTLERHEAPLALFADDPEGFAAAIDNAPAEFAESVEAAAARVPGWIAELNHGAFASAACNARGQVVVADKSFRAWFDDDDPIGSVIRRVDDGEPYLSVLAQDGNGRPVALAAGGSRAVARWPLGEAVRAALADGRASHAVVGFRPDSGGWERIARVHGWTLSETRLVAALAREGDLPAAARSLGIAHETARKQVASAMEKCGARRQTDLVREAFRLAAGDLRAPANVDRLFADLFDLTERQARAARGIAHGGTRPAVAKAMGVSEHAVKADLKIVYVACGVEAAVDLARIVAEVEALAGLATACDVALNIGQAVNDPLKLIPRGWAPGRIAVADHGPDTGFPVVILQVNVMGRAISQRFIATLQAAGLRPIAFDRAGFGLTDFVEGDPYRTATHDIDTILDALGIEQALLLSRGFSTGAITAAEAMPDRIRGGVLLGPDPPVELDRVRSGMMGAGRKLFYDNPRLAAGFTRLLAHRTSSESIARMMRESVNGSAIDLAALDDPEELATIVRAGRQSALGMHGFLNEILTHGAGARAPVLLDGSNWTIAYGQRDPLYRFDEAEAHWRATLPGVAVLAIEQGGRFLHLTHAAEIAAACTAVLARTG
ncbi:alpha/beta fold hydrolase [Sphingomonas sp. G-3-2-10]|uniref:alpha/beta fold hydrolase n=1 Tax=Sphingomonas sp. G-3-2-10 TaxID=2728838 RepID=UPI00146F48C7|nr:alpha/beta fold hydrolase [Sphingomonas sp. G-3-2-10]NML07500.1 alpha/beta fold hydrolase [Sphingomonas sp. G-3-2-10]